jgi:NAD(P)-dependent dehydrogenase (short-subunit alcohol dehydrogenase family)
MEIIGNTAELLSYMNYVVDVSPNAPILVDKYVLGKEAEVDVIADGTDCLLPGIMEHIERAGVHSGDSMAVYPPQTLSKSVVDQMVTHAIKISRALNVKGVMNGFSIVLADMVARKGGTVVSISSIAGRKTFGQHAAYCASKFAVHALSESIREEVCKDNVRVIVIGPGVTDTELLSHTTSDPIKDSYNDWKQLEARRTLPGPTAADQEIFETAAAMLEQLYKRRVALRHVGVVLSHLVPLADVGRLFETPAKAQRRELYQALDAIRDRFGSSAIIRARLAEDPEEKK